MKGRQSHKFSSLNTFLNWYYTNCQKNITLVHRGTKEESWAKRCQYLDAKYSPKVPYNHRLIMDREIVIEYDYDDAELNRRLARLVTNELEKDSVEYMVWDSGNKGSHVHVLFKGNIPQNLPLFKTTVMKYYGEFFHDEKKNLIFREASKCDGECKRLLPDLRLASTHLIRAEYGINEKTLKNKSLIKYSNKSPCLSVLPASVYEAYERAQRNSVAIRMGQQTSEVFKSDIVKFLLDTVQFKEHLNDGRNRLIFYLAQILRPKYVKENKSLDELTDFLFEWYCYASTQEQKMSRAQISRTVKDTKDYTITENTLKKFIAEVSGKTWEEIQAKGQQKLAV